ncbi:P-loop containing nucleoside triphosphate hydrolase protein [Radiomyces spectabilis]|uniref:P-loop containing nucleoside triphosphate hydrolase protein n=1 Tax=Radiomyces spectabilis TaxID=64574 RepID=UPI0022209700|nr:P-loop containing nucleoside triphosphate hydrolase protein [Radiomyces spectabilis]KAI8374157.1 P-loop containing nucleoside triphosphate hydrolase protein [Radiomyces spectabilis]
MHIITLSLLSCRQQRASMLKQLLHKIRSDTKQNKLHALDDLISDVSLRTSGYVAGDLQMLCRNAIFKSMRRQNGSSADLEQKLASMSLSEPEHSIEIEWSDFEYALSIYRPTQQAEVESTLPKRNWSEIGGYTEIKDRMKQATLWPLLKPEVFIRLGVKPPSGLLLYGPSGCGKTALVQALASESMMNVISIKGPEVFSKYLGETERKIRQLFGTAKRIAPCIVFMDEMDAIGSRRGWDTGDSGGGVNERVLSTLLNEMDGVEGRQGVVVIGCTNRPDHIDDAVLRPGRLDQLLYVGLPSLEDRRDIINALTKTVIVSHDVDKEYLAQNTEYCTGADLENLFREAGTIALRENIHIEAIHNKHLLAALDPIAERAKHEVLEEGILDICTKFQNDHSLQ